MSEPKIEPWMVDAAIALNNHVHGRLIPCNPCKESAAIIARHAPSEGVNESLLKAAKRAAAILPPHCGNPDKASYQLDEAITAAQSAPASLERELAEAALHWSVCDFPDEVDFRCEGCNKARAVLRRLSTCRLFTAKRPPTPALD